MVVYNSTDFPQYTSSEREWTKIAALRDAMFSLPHGEWFWYLDQVSPLWID
jgi:galactosyl transferase GMA12/MNN10 family